MRENAARAMLVALGVAAAYAAPTLAQTSRSLAIDTTGQSLTTAVTDLARRSGRELLVAAPAMGQRTAPRLKGRYTIDQALPLLLEGSGLAHRRTSDGTYIVYVAPALPPPEPDVPVALPELLVTARSQNSDIRRTENDIQAYKVWSSRDIEQAHSTDISEFLRLMATGDAQIASALQDPISTGASNRSEVDLRGLGSNQTLMLVDGRRMPALPSGGGLYVLQSDINGLPLAAIDRIEVLNATAGGIYGAGATAGAINVVLKRDYHGADLGVTYGITGRGDAPARRLDGRVGFSPDSGRTEIMVAFGLLRAKALSNGDRDYEVKARALRFANDPSSLLGELTIGARINVFSATRSPLSLDPAYGGASLGSAVTFAPTSYGGAASDGGALLRANAGRLDTTLSPDAAGANRALLSQREVSSLIASVRRRFGSQIETYADLLILRNDGEARIPGGIQQKAYILADAPTNPFQQDIFVSFPAPGFDPVSRNHSQTTRGSLGVIAELPRGWKANADYSKGSARIDVSLQAKLPPFGFFTAVQLGQDIDGSGPVSPLGGQQAFLDTLIRHAEAKRTSFAQINRFDDWSIRLAGPLLDLGGGPLTLTLAAEDRRDHVPPSVYYGQDLAPGVPLEVPLIALDQTARHYYAELRAPLTDQHDGPRGLKGLEFQLALRHERNWERVPANLLLDDQLNTVTREAEQSTTVYTVGFKVFPASGVMVRASAASGFLPPRTDQIGSQSYSYTSDPATSASSTRYLFQPSEFAPKDPLRAGEPLGLNGGYDVVGGGSTKLRPERAHSLSAGMVLTSVWRNRFRLSIDYTRIEKHREIASFHAYDVDYFLRNETQFSDRVIRAPLSAADRAKGLTAGVVTIVDTTDFNIGKTLVEAVDLQGDYLIQTRRRGDFRLHVAVTWQPHLKRWTDQESASVDYVGYADGPLAWRANGGADWSDGKTTVGFNVSFYDSYRVFDRLSTADEITQLTLWQGAERIPVQTYVDLFATRKFTFGTEPVGLKDMQVRFGVQNLLDHAPPLVTRLSGFGFGGSSYSTYGDPRRRRFELSLVGHF